MKRHQLFYLIIFIFVFAAAPVYCAEPKSVIEKSGNGSINWFKGTIQAVGIGTPEKPNRSDIPSDTSKILILARENAIYNLLKTVSEVRINSDNKVTHLFTDNDIVKLKIQDMVKGSKELESLRKYMTDHSVECHVQLNLHGGLAQLVLPQEIRQIESIKHIMPVKGSSAKDAAMTKNPPEHTGLVIDASGVKVKPAMAPKIYDENGEEVYGPVYASREFAVQNGMCIYSTDVNAAKSNPRVGKNPLIIKALRTYQKSTCDLVISNTNASKLLDSAMHLSFLKKCQVVIVIKR